MSDIYPIKEKRASKNVKLISNKTKMTTSPKSKLDKTRYKVTTQSTFRDLQENSVTFKNQLNIGCPKWTYLHFKP